MISNVRFYFDTQSVLAVGQDGEKEEYKEGVNRTLIITNWVFCSKVSIVIVQTAPQNPDYLHYWWYLFSLIYLYRLIRI